MSADRAARLVMVALIAALFFTYPLLSIADQPAWIGGLPLLYVYFFVVWLVLIILTGVLAGRQRPPR